MQPEQIHYKKSQKKQNYAFLFFILVVINFGYIAYNVPTLEVTLIFFAASIIAGIFTIRFVRKTAKEAVCPHCEIEFYSVIEHARSTKVPFNFCPSCGKNVKI